MPADNNGITRSRPSLPAASRRDRRALKITVIVGVTCTVLNIVSGIWDVSQGRGVSNLTLGFGLTVFWCITIPAIRRSGKF